MAVTEETMRKAKEILSLHAKGMSYRDAKKQIPLSNASFYTAKRIIEAEGKPVKQKKNYHKRGVVVTELPNHVASPQKLALVFGAPEQIAELIRAMQ